MIASLQIGNLTTRGAGGAKILADQLTLSQILVI